VRRFALHHLNVNAPNLNHRRESDLMATSHLCSECSAAYEHASCGPAPMTCSYDCKRKRQTRIQRRRRARRALLAQTERSIAHLADALAALGVDPDDLRGGV
jgi:hypothetical protein